jgi:hypothetical protein
VNNLKKSAKENFYASAFDNSRFEYRDNMGKFLIRWKYVISRRLAKKEIRIRDRLRKTYIKNKIGTHERKYKIQRNKVNNLKKSAKENFYVRESLVIVCLLLAGQLWNRSNR